MLARSPDVLNTDSIQSCVVKHIRIENDCLGHVMLPFVQRRVLTNQQCRELFIRLSLLLLRLNRHTVTFYVVHIQCQAFTELRA